MVATGITNTWMTARPLEAMGRYLDVLDEGGVPLSARVLSALGPKVLVLSAERAVGTHPYLTVPSQSAQMRTDLGEGGLVVAEQTVVLDTEPGSAGASAREFLRSYLQLDDHTSTMRRGAFTDDDVAAPGSDRLVDEVVVHVCVQVVPAGGDVVTALRALAGALDLVPRAAG